MARGRDEVQAAVDSAVRYLTSHHPRFGVQELLVLVLDVLDHRLPAVTDNRINFSEPSSRSALSSFCIQEQKFVMKRLFYKQSEININKQQNVLSGQIQTFKVSCPKTKKLTKKKITIYNRLIQCIKT